MLASSLAILPTTYNLQHPSFGPFHLQPIVIPNTTLAYHSAFQPIGSNLLVYYPLISTTMD